MELKMMPTADGRAHFLNHRTRQRGMGLIMQIVIVLIVMAVLTSGSIYGLRYAQDAKIQNEVTELQSLKGESMTYGHSSGGDFTDFSNATCAGYNFFPGNRVSGTGAAAVIRNQWNGTVTCAPATIATTNDGASFTYTGVPSYACKKAIKQVADSVATVTVGATQVKAGQGARVNDGVLATACDAGNTVTVTYTMTMI